MEFLLRVYRIYHAPLRFVYRQSYNLLYISHRFEKRILANEANKDSLPDTILTNLFSDPVDFGGSSEKNPILIKLATKSILLRLSAEVKLET